MTFALLILIDATTVRLMKITEAIERR